MRIDEFGMDTISLAGPLEAKLRAMREAGFGQVMLSARDVVGHPQGLDAAVQAVRDSGLRGTGFQVLRDFEGLSGGLHGYKVDIAKSMIEMCAALGSKVGGGSARYATAAVGSMVGGMAGREIYEGSQRQRQEARVTVCDPVSEDVYREVQDDVIGYDVTYRYGGREYTTRTDHHPGDRIRVRVDVRAE